jgi:hypothetical protein
VASPAVLDSAEYRAVGGPASTGQWRGLTSTGGATCSPASMGEVAADAHLLVLEAGAELPAPYAAGVTWLGAVGLDRSVARRGIAVVPAGRLVAGLFGRQGVDIFRPITPRIAA